MVLCVKYRRKLLLDRDIIEALQSICVEISERYWFEFKAIGTDGDHVHLLWDLHQDMRLQELCR